MEDVRGYPAILCSKEVVNAKSEKIFLGQQLF